MSPGATRSQRGRSRRPAARSSGSRRKSPGRGGARTRRGGRGRRGRRRGPGRARGLLRAGILVAAVVGLGWIGIKQLGVEEKFAELTLPLRYETALQQEAADEDIITTLPGDPIELPETDPALLAAVIYAESRFRDQTSNAGARGLMQITPDTADTIEKLSGGETFEYDDLSDPDLNIRYGSYFLRYLLHLYDGNEEAALAAYNAGIGQADAWGGEDLEHDDIRFEETRHYVEEVLEKREAYRERYAEELGL
jgi:soluble lytic murein transglycosylase